MTKLIQNRADCLVKITRGVFECRTAIARHNGDKITLHFDTGTILPIEEGGIVNRNDLDYFGSISHVRELLAVAESIGTC